MTRNKFDKKFGDGFIAGIPSGPGVYRVYDAQGELFYVGKAASLRKRISQYRLAKRISAHARMRKIVDAAFRWEWEETATHEHAELLEIRLIRDLKPRFNLTAAFSRIYPYFAVRTDPVSGWTWFAFTHRPDAIRDSYRIHGAWRSRTLARETFSALQELLSAIATPGRRSEVFGPRSGLKGSLERNALAFAYRGLDPGWLLELEELFRGESARALESLSLALLDSDRARQKSSWIEDQLKALRLFYREESRPFAESRKRLRILQWPISQEQRDEISLLARQVREGRASAPDVSAHAL